MILVLLATGGEHYLPAAQQAIKGLREKIWKQRKIYGNAAVEECETLLAILARIKPPNE
jgi:hypothetical protein